MLYNNKVVKIVLPVLPAYQPIPNATTIGANVQTILEITPIKYNFRTYTDTCATFGFMAKSSNPTTMRLQIKVLTWLNGKVLVLNIYCTYSKS